MAGNIDTKAVKGTRDFYPDDMRVRNWLFSTWRTVAARFGFEEYDSCILESEDLYIRKAGDEITSQLYNFTDKGSRRVALRPEMTPSLARMFLNRGNTISLPARWFSLPQCFRYERAQKGRKREHFQWNMDIIGLDHVAAEVELMAAQAAFMEAVGLSTEKGQADIAIKVSNRQVIQTYLESLDIRDEDFAAVCVIIDKRDKIGDDATTDLLTEYGIAQETAQKIIALLSVRGLEQLRETVGADNLGYQSLAELMELAEQSQIAHLIDIDLSVVRGLSYYTGTVWELFDASGAMPRAVSGGGRYDKLMEHLGGKPTPMVGFGFGDVVITLILEEKGLIPQLNRGIDDMIYPMQSSGFAVANSIAARLRGQGRSVLVDYSCRRFKHIIKAAEKDKIERLIILGDKEIENGVANVRNMETREEVATAIEELV